MRSIPRCVNKRPINAVSEAEERECWRQALSDDVPSGSTKEFDMINNQGEPSVLTMTFGPGKPRHRVVKLEIVAEDGSTKFLKYIDVAGNEVEASF